MNTDLPVFSSVACALVTYPNLVSWSVPSSFSSKSSIFVSCMCESLLHIEVYVSGEQVCSQLGTWNKCKIPSLCGFVPCPDWPSLVNLACFSPAISPVVKPRALSSFLSESASCLEEVCLFDSPECMAVLKCPLSPKSTLQFYSGLYML